MNDQQRDTVQVMFKTCNFSLSFFEEEPIIMIYEIHKNDVSAF